jgi:hypothetical protein
LKGSTALLTILGISFLLIGVGLVLTLPSQTAFPDSYPASQPPYTLFGSAYSVGGYFIMYIPPGSVAVQLVGYPLTSLNYFGGFIASNNPVDVGVFGLFDFSLGTPLVEVNNTLLATYFTALYSNPLAFGGVILTVVNPSNTEPAIVIGQSTQYTLSLYSNPMVVLGYILIPLGAFFALMGAAGEVARPEPLDYIPESAGGTVSAGLRVWKRIFALTIIPFGLFYSVYELLNVLGPYINSLSTPTLGGYAIAIEYVLLFVGIFFTVVAMGIAIKATSDIIEGKRPSLAQNLKHVLRRSGKMYLAYLIFSIIVGLGLILLIIPGIYLEIIFSLVLPVIVIADKGPIESFGTSKMLTENDKLRTFGVILAAGLLAAVAAIPFGIIEAYLLPQTILGLGILAPSAPITSHLLVFMLPQILGVAVLGGIILSITGMIYPVILTTWFYSLGGAYEKPQGIYVAKPGEKVMVCPNCKKTIPEGSKFCPYCGKKQK